MSTMERFAYRASEQFDAALRARLGEQFEFDQAVVGAFHDKHPGVRPVWRAGSPLCVADREVIGGFEDAHPDEDPPAGLQRSAKRRELAPVLGAAGDYWRQAVAEFNRRPSMRNVFRDHLVDVFVAYDDGRLHRLCTPGVHVEVDRPAGVWLLYPGAEPSPTEHLSAVPLSEFYAAIEAFEARHRVEA